MKDLIIIGGGPAGIVAGIYAARKNLEALLITKDFIGQLGNAGVVENWPGEKNIAGPELISNFRDHLEDYETEVKEEKVAHVLKKEGHFVVESEDGEYKSKAVIVATGRNPRPLKIPGEKEYVGKGVSYCVTCDGALFRDKSVVVVGGGNSGLEGALELAEYTKKVTVLEVRKRLAADEFLIEKAKKVDNIEIFTGIKPKKIVGDDFVTGINVLNIESEKEQLIETEAVFVQVGSIPTTDVLDDLVEYNKAGEIEIDLKTCQTATKGLFAAGDVTTVKGKQVVVAAGEGCKALLSAYDYIKNK